MTTLTFTQPCEGLSRCIETGELFDEADLEHACNMAVEECRTARTIRLRLTDENARLLMAPPWLPLDAALARRVQELAQAA